MKQKYDILRALRALIYLFTSSIDRHNTCLRAEEGNGITRKPREKRSANSGGYHSCRRNQNILSSNLTVLLALLSFSLACYHGKLSEKLTKEWKKEGISN